LFFDIVINAPVVLVFSSSSSAFEDSDDDDNDDFDDFDDDEKDFPAWTFVLIRSMG